jgi:hypothetical protein
MNAAMLIYSDANPPDSLEQFGTSLLMFGLIVIIPAAMAMLAASSKKTRSSIITYCSLLTIISGIYFTNLYSSTSDPSRGFLLLPHFALNYLFSLIALSSYGSPAENVASKKAHVSNPEADKQISMILKMYKNGTSTAGIASILNQNQEPYLLDNSEWTEEKVLVIINAFNGGTPTPN